MCFEYSSGAQRRLRKTMWRVIEIKNTVRAPCGTFAMSRFAWNFELKKCVALVALILTMTGGCTFVHAGGANGIEGFVSVDCGYNGNTYNDVGGNFKWDNDEKFTLTGINSALDIPVDKTIDNSVALQTFRYFPEVRSKHCYELPIEPISSTGAVLVRAMFLHGNSSLLTLPITFNVSLGATHWFSVQYGADDDISILNKTKEFEGTFYSDVDVVHFCLLPVTGVPFISSLELRPFVLNNDSFDQQTPDQYRWSIFRWNTGAAPGAPTQRYPDDDFDRLWRVPDSADRLMPTFTNKAQNNGYGTLTNVLQDAWLNDSPNSSFVLNPYVISTDGLQDKYFGRGVASPYFWEISPNASSSRVRGVSFAVHNQSYTLNVSQTVFIYGFPVYSLAQPLDFTFTSQPWSTLGPILNGLDLYALFEFDSSTTASTDVGALQDLKASLNLSNWQGDPCLPVPWNWLDCIYNASSSTARVNKILLSSQGIKGTIPSSISQMDALTEIRLDNNSLSGPIPDSLVDLQSLRVLLLNNNKLSGEVPVELINKTGLDFTYSGNSFSSTSKKKSKSNVGIIVGAVLGALFVFGLTLGVLTWYRRSRKSNLKEAISETHRPNVSGYIPLDLIVEATNNFAKEIGVGSYGSVYYGVLEGKEVAVKVNNIHSDQRNLEFINEVDILTRVHHKNLVSLIGFCKEGLQLILVYEHEANGTLREWLRVVDTDTNGSKPSNTTKASKFLPWHNRLQIAVNAAKGLEYLHKDCTPVIIHRDVKTSNILLGDSLVGKVADFGISKTSLDETQEISNGFFTSVKGTNGYLDPEYLETSIITQKSDVYSFGVVLAELISGRPPLIDFKDGTYSILVDELRGFVERADLQAIADPRLDRDYDEESMWRVADVALACVRRNREQRPDMTEVARNLEMIEAKAREPNSFDEMDASGLLEFSNKLR